MIGNKTQLKKLLVMLEDVITNMDCSHTEEIFGDFIEGLDRYEDSAFRHRSRAAYASDFTEALVDVQRSIYRLMGAASPHTCWGLKFETNVNQFLNEFKAQEKQKKESGSGHPAEETEPALSQPA